MTCSIIQLDCFSWRRTQKINLASNQKDYDNSETTVGKLSARIIQIFPGYFCLGNILKVIQYNLKKNAQTKIVRVDLDSPRRELSNGGLESVLTLLVHWQTNFLCASPGKAIQLKYFVEWFLPNRVENHPRKWVLNLLSGRVLIMIL